MTQILPAMLSINDSSWHWTDFRNYPGQIKSTVGILVVLSILLILLSFKLKKVDPLGKTPLWLVPLVAMVKLCNDYTKSNIGKDWKVLSPMFLTLAIFLLVANTSALWGISNPTSYLMVNAALVTFVFIIIQVTGIASRGFGGYLKSYAAPIAIMIPINIMSEFTLPLSMALRLFGNVLSSNVISALILGKIGWFAIPFMPIMNVIFDVGFGVIQVLVFLILTMIYAGMKVKDEDKIYS